MIPPGRVEPEEEIFARHDDEIGLFETAVEFAATDRQAIEPEPEEKGPLADMDQPRHFGREMLLGELKSAARALFVVGLYDLLREHENLA